MKNELGLGMLGYYMRKVLARNYSVTIRKGGDWVGEGSEYRNAPTQHQQRRWPDFKQILETSSTQA